MSMSKKGKKASRKLAVKSLTETIEKKFEGVDFNARRKVYDNLVLWAKNELGIEQQEIFFEALHNVSYVKDIEIIEGVENAMKRL